MKTRCDRRQNYWHWYAASYWKSSSLISPVLNQLENHVQLWQQLIFLNWIRRSFDLFVSLGLLSQSLVDFQPFQVPFKLNPTSWSGIYRRSCSSFQSWSTRIFCVFCYLCSPSTETKPPHQSLTIRMSSELNKSFTSLNTSAEQLTSF